MQNSPPPKWSRIADYYKSYGGDPTYFSYKSKTGGHDGGSYLVAEESQQHFDYESYMQKTMYDLLITPLVKGTISFYVKNYVNYYYTPIIKIYTCTKKDDGTFTFDAGAIKEYSTANINSNWQQISFEVADWTYLGFRLEYVSIDDFEASFAEVERVNSLAISSANVASDKFYANAQSEATVSINATIRNNGDFDLTHGTENYSLSILRRGSDNELVEIGTTPIDFDLAVGESHDINVTAKVDAGDSELNTEYFIRENFIGKTKSAGYATTIPYIQKFAFTGKGDAVNLSASDVIDMGVAYQTDNVKVFQIKNEGSKPMVVNSVTLPDGFTLSGCSFPVTVGGQSAQDVSIALSAAETGTKEGSIVFDIAEVTPDSYPITGYVADPDRYFENFESGKIPGTFLNDAWLIKDYPKTQKIANNEYCADQNSNWDTGDLITPKLTVEEGETLVFFSDYNYYVSYASLTILYSDDRKNWQEVASFREYDFTDKFKKFTVEGIPAGNHYICFRGKAVSVDNISGFTLTPVDHDLMLSGFKASEKAVVNSTYTASLSMRNLNSVAEAADSYTVKLYLDGEVVAEAETPEFEAGSSKTFDLTFTPHAAGTFTAYMEFVLGENVFTTDEYTLVVAEESQTETIAIGTRNNWDATTPIRANYCNSTTQTLYTQEMLAEYGLQNGAKIVQIAYDGYSDNNKADVTFNVKAWIKNTSDTYVDYLNPCNTDEMTLVYDSQWVNVTAGSSGAPVEDFLALPFSEPFTYEGGALWIVVEALNPTPDNTSNYKGASFAAMDKSGYALSKNKDRFSDYESTSLSTCNYIPVVKVSTEKTVYTIGGLVTDIADNSPIANANIVLSSGEVEYYGTTDETGAYSVEVLQAEKDYTMTVSATGYKTATVENISFAEGNVSKNVELTEDTPATVGNNAASALRVYGAQGYITVSAPEATTVNVYNAVGALLRSTRVEAGTIRLEGFPAGIYIVNNVKVVVR